MSTIEPFHWREHLEQWNAQAMDLILRTLRRNGVADLRQYGFGEVLQYTAQEHGAKIPETLFEPLGDVGSDGDILAEARRRMLDIETLILAAKKDGQPAWNHFEEHYYWTVVRNGGHFFPPATDEQIAEAEQRLGTKFAPSYKAFLRVTNGWLTVSSRILPVGRAEWLRDKGPEWVEDFGTQAGEDPEKAMLDHRVYGSQQYPPRYRRAYVKECLQLSDRLAEGNCVFLLNPALVFEDGECEAWFLAAWLPGARRFKSFLELMDWMKTVDLNELHRCEEQRRPLR